MKAVEAEDDCTGDNENKAEEDKSAAEVRHCAEPDLDGGEKLCGFAEEFSGLAGLGEDAYGTGEGARVFANLFEVGVEAGEEDHAAGGEFACDVVDEGEAVAMRHGDVAEEKIGRELAGVFERLFGGVRCLCPKATLLEDHGDGVCDKTIIIDNKNSLHRETPEHSLWAIDE
jgi:hypothetical protein